MAVPRQLHEDPNRAGAADAAATATRPHLKKRVLGRTQHRAPYSIWRRMVLAEVAQVELDLNEAELNGSPYPNLDGYDFDTYLDDADTEIKAAFEATRNERPNGPLWAFRLAGRELVRVWTGSEHETAMAALHRAEGLLLMVAPEASLRAEALKIEATFLSTSDIPHADPRHAEFTALFARMKERPTVALKDRVLLREVRQTQDESWEIARARVRIFRNILSATIPFLTASVLVAALVAGVDPRLIPLRGTTPNPSSSDVLMVLYLGALGGLLSSVATLQSARNYRRFYGLPLAQSLLKIPAGAASGLVGVLLLQESLFGVKPVSWDTAMADAVVFGVAQIALTKKIDTRAGDLLGDVNAKSPTNGQSTSASRSGVDDG